MAVGTKFKALKVTEKNLTINDFIAKNQSISKTDKIFYQLTEPRTVEQWEEIIGRRKSDDLFLTGSALRVFLGVDEDDDFSYSLEQHHFEEFDLFIESFSGSQLLGEGTELLLEDEEPSLTSQFNANVPTHEPLVIKCSHVTVPPPGGQGSPLEVVLSFDTTGSMGDCIVEFCKSAQSALNKIFENIPNIHICCLAHGDYIDRIKYITKFTEFTRDTDMLCAWMEEVETTYGGDWEECYELVLHEVRTKLGWTGGTRRTVIMIGDAIPHALKDSEAGLDWEEELESLVSQLGVKIYAIQCFDNVLAREFWGTLAQRSGGKHLHLDSFDHITEYITAICYREQGLAHFKEYEQKLRAHLYSSEQGEKLLTELDGMLSTLSAPDISADSTQTVNSLTITNKPLVNSPAKPIPSVLPLPDIMNTDRAKICLDDSLSSEVPGTPKKAIKRAGAPLKSSDPAKKVSKEQTKVSKVKLKNKSGVQVVKKMTKIEPPLREKKQNCSQQNSSQSPSNQKPAANEAPKVDDSYTRTSARGRVSKPTWKMMEFAMSKVAKTQAKSPAGMTKTVEDQVGDKSPVTTAKQGPDKESQSESPLPEKMPGKRKLKPALDNVNSAKKSKAEVSLKKESHFAQKIKSRYAKGSSSKPKAASKKSAGNKSGLKNEDQKVLVKTKGKRTAVNQEKKTDRKGKDQKSNKVKVNDAKRKTKVLKDFGKRGKCPNTDERLKNSLKPSKTKRSVGLKTGARENIKLSALKKKQVANAKTVKTSNKTVQRKTVASKVLKSSGSKKGNKNSKVSTSKVSVQSKKLSVKGDKSPKISTAKGKGSKK